MKRAAKTSKVMVFCSTVASATFHCMMMGACGFHDHVLMLHGKMKHRQRLQTFDAFLQWDTGVLFCTDVAARGLDIPQVTWVVQLDPPVDPTEYIHRIGRTARAGAVGSALIFLRPEERAFLAYAKRFGLDIRVTESPRYPDIQDQLEHVLEIDPVVARAAVSGFRAAVGAYSSHVLKTVFDPDTIDLDALAKSFALNVTPSVPGAVEDEETGKKIFLSSSRRGGKDSKSASAKREEYVKGRFKSLHRRKMSAIGRYHRDKTKPQWSEDGHFIGTRNPLKRK
jgi:superfamily II DNA/RNA helicase